MIVFEIVMLSNARLPLPAIRKPQYAIAKVHGIMRRMLIGPTSTENGEDYGMASGE